jgi:type I restriction enzyme stySJI specificity protein
MKIGDVLVEFKLSPVENHEYEILTLTEKNGFIRQVDRFKKRLATEDISKYKVVERNTIAFNPYLLWAGALALNDNFDSGIVSPLYPTFRVKEDVDAEYLFAVLLSPQMIQQFDQISYGSVPRKRRSSVKDFLNLQLPELPSLGEQKRIAEILGGVFKAISEVRTEIKRVESLCGAVVSLYAEDQSTKKLEDLATLSGGLSLGSHRKNKPHSVGYLRVANVFWGKILYDEIKELNCTDQEFERTLLQDGDVLITEAHANRFQVGRSAVFRGEEQALVFQNHLFRARPNKNIDSDVLAAMLSSVAVRRQLYQMAKTTSGLNTISISQVRSLRVPVLDTTKQAELLSFLQESNKLNHLLHRKLSLLQELQKSLATRAFAGLL